MIVSALAQVIQSAVAFGFLAPWGLFAALSIVPLVALYLLKPDPTELELPTTRFLHRERGTDKQSSAFETLPRSLLLLVQVLVIVLLAVSLAAPYVPVSADETVEETVIVVDASASMATEAGDETRFSRAIDAARAEIGDETTVVVAADRPRVVVQQGTSEDAAVALESLRANDVSGDLGSAIDQAITVAGEGARILVLSDFAGGSDWQTPLQVARARDLPVELRQFGGGGGANVGIVDVAFQNGRVAATVRNYGDEAVERTLSFGDRSVQLSLSPADTVSRSFPVPVNGSELRLRPGDSFATDDTVPVAAPGKPSIDVLLLSNHRDEELETALRVVDTVNLTVKHPPAGVGDEYDLVIFGAVESDRVLEGTVDTANAVLADGGGVVVTATPNASDAGYGDLLLIEPSGVDTNATVSDDVRGTITEDISFPPPDNHLEGELGAGTTLVNTSDGAPLLASATVGEGRVLYYGYLGNETAFEYNYMYPVFWKRVAYEFSGRPSLDELNRETGTRLDVEAGTTVQAPHRSYDVEIVPLSASGFYRVGDRQYAAALVDPVESDVGAPSIEETASSLEGERVEQQTARIDLTALGIAAAVVLLLVELGFLYYRGDL